MRALTMLFATTTLLSGFAATATAGELSTPQATQEQRDDMEGSYALSDGRRAQIFEVDGRLYIALGRQRKERERKELELAGPDRWVTRDRSFSVLFKPGQPADKIVLNYGDAADIAPVRLAANEARQRGSVD